MGILEEAKGKVKEAAGKIAGQDDLRAEGEAQADKGAEERKATEARAKAEAHEKKADLHEQDQRAAESS
jgi:uncharacterized protein YjbJ (UPF0337 family)